MGQEIRELSLEEIHDPATPMRTGLEKDQLHELAESIKANGLINPITVRPKDGRYEVVAGHRRFRACAIAGLFRIPCVISDLDDDKAFDIMAAENLNRQDIDPVEEALFLGRLVGESQDKIPSVAKRVNRSVAWVEDRLEILTFSDSIVAALKEGKIKLGVAQWLGRIDNEFWQGRFLQQAIDFGMNILQSRLLHDQYKMGVFQKPEDFIPSDLDGVQAERPLMKVMCEACGKAAVEPNFKSVFIHLECPHNESPTI